MSKKYDDIIDLDYIKSNSRPQMSMCERAGQFAPFAALVGHQESIDETARLVDSKIELDENDKAILDYKLAILLGNRNDEFTFIYFVQDSKKLGGQYVKCKGIIKKIDEIERKIILENGIQILIDDLLDIESTLFNNVDF